MGKEKKIGLAVLAVLLIVFGIVLVRRLTRPAEETTAADATEKPAAASKTETSGDDSKPAGNLLTANRPTVLSPAKLSGGAAAHPPDDVSSQWITANAADAPKKSSSRGASSSGEASVASDLPPASIPGPPTPTTVDSYAPSGDARQAAPTAAPSSMAQAGRTDGSPLAPARAVVDPFQSHADSYAPAAGNVPSPSAGQTSKAPPPAYGQGSPDGGLRGRETADEPPPRDPNSSASASSAYSPPPRDSYAKTWSSQPSPTLPPSSAADTGSVYSRGSTGAADDSGFGAPARPKANRWSGGPSAGSDEADAAGRAGGTYEVQPNDNYWAISQKVYGSGAYFKALAEHNRGKVAQRDKLRVGDTIATPTIAQLERLYPDLCPKPSRREAVRNRATLASTHGGAGGRSYEVQEGDTLFDIARNELGKATRWAEIYELNRDALGKDFDYLTPGMLLILPPKDAPAPIDKTTRRPGSAYDR